MRRLFAAFTCAATLSLLVVGCGGGGGGGSDSTIAADVTVHASDALRFDAKTYSAASSGGAVTIQYVDDGSETHSLVIDGVSGFRLQVNSKGQAVNQSVLLQPGTYTIYCDIPGHRQAGMQATLTVT